MSDLKTWTSEAIMKVLKKEKLIDFVLFYSHSTHTHIYGHHITMPVESLLNLRPMLCA